MPLPLAAVALLSLTSTDVRTAAPESLLVGTGVPPPGRPVVGVAEEMQASNGLQIILTANAKVGAGAGFDVGAALDHSLAPFLGPRTLTAAHLSSRKRLYDSGPEGHFKRVALYLDVSAAWFGSAPSQEQPGDPRLWKGLRDYNAELGAWFSIGGGIGVFGRVAVLGSLDTHPPPGGPLGGVPAAMTYGATGIAEVGSHLDAGHFHALMGVRLMVHSRSDDERISLVTFIGMALG
jgi:hypothetical protein